MERIDLAVAGGGPAGLASAIEAAARGLDVVVFEPRRGVIDKACGEGLMPAARVALERLGVEGVRGYPFRGIRYRDARRGSVYADGDFPSGAGIGVRRVELHRALLERARELGVQWRHERLEGVDARPGEVVVGDLRASYLIVADGLHSRLRRALDLEGGTVTERRRFGIRRHFRQAPWSDRVEVFWGERAEAYVTPVSEETIGVAMLFEDSGRFEELLEEFPALSSRLEGPVVTEARGAGPFDQRAERRVEGRVLLVGDAAGYLDPLTGEGIALGLATAREAVGAIVRGRPGDYEGAWRRVTRRYFWMTGALLAVTRPKPVRRVLVPVLDRVPGVFDAALALLGEA